VELPVYDKEHKTIQTVYATFTVDEPVIWALLESPAMQRIMHVHQYGISNYVDNHVKAYSRFDHSVGVWALLRLYGARLEEQIAGLLHDVSHTVFSHTGDYLFLENTNDGYQDGIHEWYLKRMGIDLLVQEHGISFDDILHKNGTHRALEQELPDLCADRIEYNIQEGLMNGMICKEEVPELLKTLFYEDGVWYFTDIAFARKLGLVSLYGTENQWGGPNAYIQNTYAANALKQAVQEGLITVEEIHFSHDAPIWQTLCEATNQSVVEQMNLLFNYRQTYTQAFDGDPDIVIRTKLRGINPFVQLADGSKKRLVDIDPLYQAAYNKTKEQCTSGWQVKMLHSPLFQRFSSIH